MMPALTGLAQSGGNPHGEAFVKPLIASTIPEIVRRFGNPIEAVPLRETGGKLYIFETPHHDYYVIETDIGGNVVDAVVKHPEGR